MADTDKYTTSNAAPPASSRSTGSQTGGGSAPTEEMKREAQHAKRRAQTQVSQAAERAKQQGQRMVDEQKSNAVNHMDKIAKALHDTARSMREQDETTAGNMIDQAANGLEQVASRLRDQDPQTLYYQVRDMARRQPALFIGGTIAAGFLLSRFLKSSSDESHPMEERMSGGSDSDSYVTSAHANPDEVVAGRAGVPPEMPSGRRNY